MNPYVLILGSNAATPSKDRNPSAQILFLAGKTFLIDCAEGTQMQLVKYKIKFNNIENIFISHLHGDHYFGLISLISSFHLLGRKNPLHIYANADLKNIIDIQLQVSKTTLQYPLYFHSINAEAFETIFEDSNIEIKSFPLEHSISTSGFLFKEKKKERNINKSFLRKEKPSIEEIKKIKNGADYINNQGKKYSNEDITFIHKEPCSYAYCSDTRYSESIIKYISGVNILYHEATFKADRQKNAYEKFHSTTTEAGLIAKKANVKKLIIGHFSSRYDNLTELIEETKTVFKNSEIAEQGKKFLL
ncbi:MAG: ribonuclease Z [Bacteroidales bacterium]|nr:ribonuclease Z [Bacteroidales bacterium]